MNELCCLTAAPRRLLTRNATQGRNLGRRDRMENLVRDGVTLAFEQAGSGDPPLLLVHCWCCDHSFLEPQFQHFKERHRVISVDLRGHGESDKPQQEYTLAGFAEDLVWLCGQLNVQKPVAIGHSMGGNTV